jgi:hypothetical protein
MRRRIQVWLMLSYEEEDTSVAHAVMTWTPWLKSG